MKIVLYGRRTTCLITLNYLLALGHEVEVMSDDENVLWMAERLGCTIIKDFEGVYNFDLFICVHGNKIIPKQYLQKGKMINIHPCLFKYPGHNPIKKYIANKDTKGSVESHFMTEEIDMGNLIHQEFFETPICNTFADYYNVALPYYLKCLDATLNKLIQ